MVKTRADLLPASLSRRLSDWELRDSIATVGVLEPVLYYRGELLDGHRRSTIARALRAECPRIDLDDRIGAARHLWRVHPRRAYQRFAPARARRSHLVFLFGCAAGELPDRNSLHEANHPGRRRGKATMRVLGGLDVERAVYEQALAACHAQGVTLSEMVRWWVYQLAGVERTHPVKRSA